MNITQFTIEEVRCFAERQEFNIRPLTFLVGENSTGKTTALACFQVLANYLIGKGIDFNSDPYSMGVFRDIVRNSKKKKKAFELGFTLGGENEDVECTVEFAKKQRRFEPFVKATTVKFIDGEIVLRASNAKRNHVVSFDKEQNHYCVDVNSDFLNKLCPFNLLSIIYVETEGEKALDTYMGGIYAFIDAIAQEWGSLSVFSTAPVRSQPKRTYDPTREFDDPEGSDIPIRLMQIKATNKQKWEALKVRLVEFGKLSGLFQNIDVNNLGGSMGNPFQLKVKVRGPNSNIIDVGYGVSQILPILVHILDPPISRRDDYRAGDTIFLLQRPEVHLHPRAQAELSSLLATLASEGNRAFIVETHSDYMIDRARIEIRKGNIRPEDVSLIYLEPKGNVVKVHNISFDKMGNMEGVPQHYREFFMTEYRRLMGFED